jgi:hypothetical protein
MTSDDQFHELCGYTLSLGDPAFVHQHVVDAFAAQTADHRTKPIKLAFALIGLYLHVERGFSGRRVQQVHMKLARRRRSWPTFELPASRGAWTVRDVLAAPAGLERLRAISAWAAAVWQAFHTSHGVVKTLADDAA